MADAVALKYRAFISYSHADTRWVKRLHGAIERFRVDKDLVGRETGTGKVPPALRPIFRDRDDFTAGHSLTEQTLAALDASSALIVVCSPAAARSRYVDEEVRLFRQHRPARPVIPVIVGGRPGGGEDECFPPALRFKIGLQGQTTSKPEQDMLAADASEDGDGFHLAVAKVVARMLGLGTDDVFRRAERERRRQGRLRNGVIAVLACLAVAATGSAVYAWQQLKTNEAFLNATLKRATEIVNTAVAQAEKYNMPRAATLELLKRAEGLFEDMALLGRPTPELQRQKAWMLIEFARNYAILGDTGKQRERAEEASRIMASLAADKGDDLNALRDLSVAHDERGDVLVAQGSLPEALKAFRDSLAIRERLGKVNPTNAEWQRDLSVTYQRVGDVLVAQGNLPEALKAFQDSLAIDARLARADPGNTLRQRDLSISYERIGNVLREQGNLSEALKVYQDSLAIRDQLAEADPGNAGWQRDLSISYNKVGDVLIAQGKLPEALAFFRDSLAIRDRLAKGDAGSALWQRDLSLSYGKIGEVLRDQGNLPEALKAFEDSLAIDERLAKADPANSGWQRDVSVSYVNVGDVLVTQGNLPEALKLFRHSLAIRDGLAKADPSNAQWQRDLSFSYGKIADVLQAQGSLPEALEALSDSLAIDERLAKVDPDNTQWQADLAIARGKLGQLYVKMKQPEKALGMFKAGRTIAVPLAARPGNQRWIGYVNSLDAYIAVLENAQARK